MMEMLSLRTEKERPSEPAEDRTKISNQYHGQSSTVAPEDTAFESCTEKPVRVEATEIIPTEVRFSALTNYRDELHFHAA